MTLKIGDKVEIMIGSQFIPKGARGTITGIHWPWYRVDCGERKPTFLDELLRDKGSQLDKGYWFWNYDINERAR